MRLFSHHSSNPLEARSSDNLNASYNRLYATAVKQHQPSDLSSEDPLHAYDAPDQYSRLKKYQQHVADVVKVIDEDAEMRELEDEQEERKEQQEEQEEQQEEQEEQQEEQEEQQEEQEEQQEEQEELQEEQDERQEEQDEQQFSSPLSSPFSSPLTPLSPLPSSPASSRPPSPTESLSGKPQDEQDEILQEISHLNKAIPFLSENYQVIDRLGTGTFSSVYKAIDLRYHDWDNKPWKGKHPPESSAYYQSAEPGYRGRGGRGPGVGKDKDKGKGKAKEDEASNVITDLAIDSAEARDYKVYVAIKRIYTTSGPERIRNELAIMQSCRGCRHTSQIITAYRHLDQVALVLPYQRNMDFREFYQTLPLEGIKSYFRCLFRALRDIHARGIIHRDVKPANFLYDPYTGIGTLCDFGLASRMENGQLAGQCYHTPASPEEPHGKNRNLTPAQTEEVKKAQKEARGTSLKPSDRVGYPENDRRVVSKANRAGTRGFRAPEVLLKCGAQTGAIDVWSAGVILLFFLTGKFPIFQSNDDIEGLMEIATIIGRRQMERTATLHSRTLATNIPSLENDGISWQEFVERLNPKVWKLRDCDMRFYPHNSKHRDGRNRSGWPGSTATPVADGDGATPVKQTEATASSTPTTENTTNTDAQTNSALERHQREFQIIFHLLEKLLHPESTKRCTPQTALLHPMLAETGTSAPLPPLSDAWAAKIQPGNLRKGDDAYIPHAFGGGVCGDWHFKDEVTEVECIKVLEKCLCMSCVGSESEDELVIEGEEEGWCGQYIEQIVQLTPGEGIAIGDRPCQFHEDDVYANCSSAMME